MVDIAHISNDRCLVKENEVLEERIQLLSKELTFLKDIFLAHAGRTHGMDASSHLGLLQDLLRDNEVGMMHAFLDGDPKGVL